MSKTTVSNAIETVKAQAAAGKATFLSEHETPAGWAPWKHYLTYEVPHISGKPLRVVFGVDAAGKIDRTMV